MRFAKNLAVSIISVVVIAAGAAVLAQTKAPSKSAVPKTAPVKSSFDPALLHPDTLKATAPAEFEVTFATTRGNFVVKVTRAWAPIGADRFYNLVKHHYYDGCAFYRIASGFIVQFGISPYPSVTAAWDKAAIKDDPVKESNKRGFVTYAMAGPNTRTTELFINFADRNAGLDNQGFAPFGQVTEGMDVVDGLYGGYGDFLSSRAAPQPDKISKEGKAYLDKNFPKLDGIKTATITSSAPSAAPAKTPAKKSS